MAELIRTCPSNMEGKCAPYLKKHTYDLGKVVDVSSVRSDYKMGPSEFTTKLATMTVYTSNDNANWTPIGSKTLKLGVMQYTSQFYCAPCRYVKLETTTIQGASNPAYMDYSKIYVNYTPDPGEADARILDLRLCKFINADYTPGPATTSFLDTEQIYCYCKISKVDSSILGGMLGMEWLHNGQRYSTDEYECPYNNTMSRWWNRTPGVGTGKINISWNGVYKGSTDYYTVTDADPPPDPPPPTPDPPEPPGDCPSFWEDPIGWSLCTIANTFDAFMGWFSTTFFTWVLQVQNWFEDLSNNVKNFLADPIGKVQDWVNDIIPVLGDWWNGIILGVRSWYDSNIQPTVDTLRTNIDFVGRWVNVAFININEWWDAQKTSVQAWINERVEDITDFWNKFPGAVSNWWTSTALDVHAWIDNSIKGVTTWIDETKDNIGTWWNARLAEVQLWVSVTFAVITDFWTSTMQSFSDWLGELGQSIADYIGEQVINLQTWVIDEIPGMVINMFDWAKPIIQPIIDASDWLGQIGGILTSTRPKEPEIIEAEETIKEHQDAAKDILDGMED